MELEEQNAVRINALSNVIAALIITHPSPAAFAQVLRQGLGGAKVEQIGLQTPSAARQLYDETVTEMIQIAESAHTDRGD
jgi:hypothetical protein